MTPHRLFPEAAMLFQRGQAKEAARLCRTILDETPDDAIGHYLLALCLHEKAVRAQSQADRDPATKPAAVEAWATAADAWNRFLATADAGGSGRVGQAKKLLAQATRK